MYRVLVVDDEPSAVEYICNIIKMKCPELSVSGTAENGEEGVKAYKALKPDLVVSDVKMPVMDGLEMVKAIKSICKEAQVLLVSGYQEFEYVKAAIQYGVFDYVLKPMTPAGFAEAVAPAVRILNQRAYDQRKRLVRAMVTGEQTEYALVEHYFPEKWYHLAVIRENGLPRRLMGAYELELISEEENTIFIYGRDEKESMYICPAKAAGNARFRQMMEKEAVRRQEGGSYVTAVWAGEPIDARTLTAVIPELYKCLGTRLSVGKNQFLSLAKEISQDDGAQYQRREAEWMKKAAHCLERREYTQLMETLWKFMEDLGREEYPQLRLERMIRQLAGMIQQNSGYEADVFEEEMMFEDAFYCADSLEALYDSIKSIFIRYWRGERESIKLDSPEFIEEIQRYLICHLTEDLTVISICREFSLSQSYLNLIFRKHRNQSFNTYVRNLRIEEAKRMMDRYPQMFVKDVALMSGYKDQFYFSRIFRAVTGMSPSEYLDGNQQGEERHAGSN